MPPLFYSCVSGPVRQCRRFWSTAGGLFFFFAVSFSISGQSTNTPSLASTGLTNIYEIWTLPQEERAQPHPIKTEMVIYYFDAEWNNAWGECEGRPAWLPVAD